MTPSDIPVYFIPYTKGSPSSFDQDDDPYELRREPGSGLARRAVIGCGSSVRASEPALFFSDERNFIVFVSRRRDVSLKWTLLIPSR